MIVRHLPHSIDAFVPCRTPGCRWRVRTPFPTVARCYQHGAVNRYPQFLETDEGEIVRWLFMPSPEPDQDDPEPAA